MEHPNDLASAPREVGRWGFHDTADPLTRYLRDRRLTRVLRALFRATGCPAESWERVLVVCGGVGGEGTFLRRQGFRNVTVSEFDPDLLQIMGQRDPKLKATACDAQRLAFADNSFDLVLVQDGIHHLRNPALGVTEMLRVARRAVIVIEPHEGIVARWFGTKIEQEAGHVNFVFRWNRRFFQQVVSSFLVGEPFSVKTLRFWDHSLVMLRLFSWLPGRAAKLSVIRTSYGFLDGILPFLGNMFVGLLVLRKTEIPSRDFPG